MAFGDGETMQASAESTWASAQQFLRTMLHNSEIYNLWFAPLRASALDHDSITLEVANEFCEVWLKDNYLDLLRDVLSRASGQPMDVTFHVSSTSGSAKPTESAEVEQSAQKEESVSVDRASGVKELPFNPKNTFDTFVVGNNNTFAHAAAIAVAQAPGKSYNPLFLYGGVGLGKTHLLHAIGQHVVKNKKGVRVTYVSTEKFTNEFIDG